jgi:hypothetical protein
VPAEECPDDVLGLADEEEAAGCAATMTLDQAKQRLRPKTRNIDLLMYSDRYPILHRDDDRPESDAPDLEALALLKRSRDLLGSVLSDCEVEEEARVAERPPRSKPSIQDTATPTAQSVSPGDHGAETPRPDLVTLDQAAGMVHRKKRGLEYYKKHPKKPLPRPTVKGGVGQFDQWEWGVIRPWLVETFNMPMLPPSFPGNRKS